MVIDSHHSTPREMMFESARVRKRHREPETFSLSMCYFLKKTKKTQILQKRDAFCHLLQLMKTRHSQQSEPDVISVFVGTWNMGKLPPPTSGGPDAVGFLFLTPFLRVCRGVSPSAWSAELGDLLRSGAHPR